MANHKQGLSYYNIDTDRYADRRIKRLKKAFGCNGLAVYDYILCEVYRDRGCGLEWDEDTAFDVADYLGLKESVVSEIVKYCGAVGLFDATLLTSGIITSASIQKRYLDICERSRRKDYEIPEAWLCLKMSEESPKMSEESQKIPSDSSILPNTRAFIERKEKKNKENNLSLTPSLGDESRERETFLEIFFFKNFRRPLQEVDRFIAHYSANGWCRKGESKPVKSKVELAKCWEPKNEDQRFQPDVLKNWENLYSKAREINPSKALLLLTGIYAIDVSGSTIRLKATKELRELMYGNPKFFNDEFFLKYYSGLTILWD